jgi:hypothetical protein
MSGARRVEVGAAVACLVLAVLAALFTLFGPTITVSTQSSTSVSAGAGEDAPDQVVSTTEHWSLYDDGIEPAAGVYIGLMLALAVGIAVLAAAHGRAHVTRAAAPLWAVAGAMLALALIAGFSIGLFFFPAALAAIIAAVAGTMSSRQLRRSPA